MFYQIKHYLKFLLRSTNQHGVHSPFVYNLVTRCFYDKKTYLEYKKLKKFRADLKSSNNFIKVTDFGAGSKTLNTETRTVSHLVKHVAISNNNAKLLFRISNYFEPKYVLELGTSLGLATQALSLGCPNAKITTIEGCPELSKYTKSNFEKLQLKNISLINNDFSKAISNLGSNKLDLVIFDGNHTKTATLAYFKSLLPKVHNDTIFIFDDIYWSKGMTEAWQTIKKHPKVKVTIDTFFWGLVFFRQEQAKQHFSIRT